MSQLPTKRTWRNKETAWALGLSPVRSNSRWVLFAAIRNSPGTAEAEGRAGVHGVRREELLEAIWNALERAYAFLIAQGRTPLQSHPPRVQIYVFALDDPEHGCGDPLTTQLLFGTPSGAGKNALRIGTVITLPSRSNEPQWESELAQILAATVHELSHCLNMQVLPLRKFPLNKQESPATLHARELWIDSWRWLDEGMAVAAEASFAEHEQRLRQRGDAQALPMTSDWLRFGLDWVDRPERSLDDPRHVYQAAFFVRYLQRLMGAPTFLNEVWNLSRSVWGNEMSKDCSALAMLAQALGQSTPSRVFCSATEPDVFASGYCFDSYFLNDAKSNAFEPDVFARFKERAITRTWRMAMSKDWPDGKAEKHTLHGLACRYFRFVPPQKAERLLVRVLPAPGKTSDSFKYLKAEIAFAFVQSGQLDNGYRQHGPDGIAMRKPLSGADGLTCEIANFSMEACAHAVLVVANCDYGDSASNQRPPTGYKQSAEFCVEARLI